ncbi:hypothetical protein P153DRAFT_304387, partial [Dothidotthia symphoricarpi CBS 119687]
IDSNLEAFSYNLVDTSYLYSNFSSTSSLKFQETKGLIGYTFILTKNLNTRRDFYPFTLLEISVLYKSLLGHLYYSLIDVLP